MRAAAGRPAHAAAGAAPPMPMVCGPPAGNVPLVAWPSVCTAQVAGASSTSPRAATSDDPARPRPGRPTASTADQARTGDEQRPAAASVSSPGRLCSTISSVATAPATPRQASTRAVVPPPVTCGTSAPTSAAVNGASSET